MAPGSGGHVNKFKYLSANETQTVYTKAMGCNFINNNTFGFRPNNTYVSNLSGNLPNKLIWRIAKIDNNLFV